MSKSVAMPLCIALMFATLGAGCATTEGGPEAGLATGSTGERASAGIPAGKARLSFSRPSGIMAAAASARVKINGDSVADLYPGGSKAVDIAPGKVSITVDNWGSLGEYQEDLQISAGTVYSIEVTVREEAIVTSMVFGVVGSAIETANNPTKSGTFQWRLTGQTKQPAAAPATAAKPVAKTAPKKS